MVIDRGREGGEISCCQSEVRESRQEQVDSSSTIQLPEEMNESTSMKRNPLGKTSINPFTQDPALSHQALPPLSTIAMGAKLPLMKLWRTNHI